MTEDPLAGASCLYRELISGLFLRRGCPGQKRLWHLRLKPARIGKPFEQEFSQAGLCGEGVIVEVKEAVLVGDLLSNILEGRGCVGVYLDDMFCGTRIYGNVFYRVTRAAFIGGGRDCEVVNNLFVDCEPALHIDARALTWASYHVDTTMKERLEAMPYRSALWRGRYPVLAGILEDEAAAPKGNVVTRNVCWGGRWDGVAGEARAYVDLSGNVVDIDPLFLAEPPSSFELAENSPAWGKGFEPIPLREIGLYADGYRRQGVR